jgi:Family of unknown function (DUF6069)
MTHQTTTTAADVHARPAVTTPPSRPAWQVSAIAGLIAAVATELYGLGARAAGVPMVAAGLGSAKARPITVGMFAMGTLISTFWGTILALVLARYVAHPARVYLRATVALTALSLAVPLSAADTAMATKVTLAGAHLLAAAIIIPVVTTRLSRRQSRRP